MAAEEYYNHTTVPATGSPLSSATIRSEFDAVEQGFAKLPNLSGNGNKIVKVNAGGTALDTTDAPDINGGTIDGAVIGGSTPAAGAFTNLSATGTVTIPDDSISGDKVEGGTIAATTITTLTGTTANVTNINATTVDATNLEVTSLKAKDGTAAGSIANATGVVTLNSAVLTTADINGGTIDGTTIGATTPSTGAFTTVTTTGDITQNNATYLRGKTSAGTTTRLFGVNSGNVLYLGGIDTSLSGGLIYTNGGATHFSISGAGAASFAGNVTLGDASTDTVQVNGYMGVGGAPATNYVVKITSSTSGNTSQQGVYAGVTFDLQTTFGSAFYSAPATAATTFTANDVVGYRAVNASKGAGSTITNLHGLYINDQTVGTNNYGITSLVSSGTNKWNIYASGTAANYFAGKVLIGDGSGNGAIGSNSTTGRVIYSGGLSGAVTDSGAFLARAQSAATNPFGVEIWTNNAERLRIDSSGNVGIGTTSPGAALDVVSSSTNSQGLRVRGRSSDNIGTVLYTDNDGTTQRGFLQSRGDNEMRLFAGTGSANGVITTYTANTERLRIDASGNVGIGTSAPATGLEVSSGTFRNQLTVHRANGSATTTMGSVALAGNNGSGTKTTYAQIEAYSGSVAAGAENGNLLFSTVGSGTLTERLRITPDGYLRMASGSLGIQFNGDTAAANALDDYEEGTFTPTIVGTTTAGTGTYSTQVGRYTKIGNRVYFAVAITWSAHTGTGNMRIGALPFTSANVTNGFGFSAVGANNLTYPAQLTAYVESNSTQCSFATFATGAALTPLAIDTAASVYVSGHYEV